MTNGGVKVACNEVIDFIVPDSNRSSSRSARRHASIGALPRKLRAKKKAIATHGRDGLRGLPCG